MVNFKENYNFPRFLGGPIFSRGYSILYRGEGGPIANSYGNL